MKGLKTGGREKGTPNRKTQGIAESIAERFPNYHPVIALAEIANDPSCDIIIRMQAHKEVAKYLCPQLKAVSVNLVEDIEPERINLSHLSYDELDKLITKCRVKEPDLSEGHIS